MTGVRLRRIHLPPGAEAGVTVRQEGRDYAAYPRAPADGPPPIGPGWPASWRVAQMAGGGLLPLAPALMALGWAQAPVSALTIVAAGLLWIGLVLLSLAAVPAAVREARDGSVALHGRVWDRLLMLPAARLGRLSPDGVAWRTEQGLEAGLALAAARDAAVRHVPPGLLGLVVIGLVSPRLAALAVAVLLAGGAFLVRLAARARARQSAAATRGRGWAAPVPRLAEDLAELRSLGAGRWLRRRRGAAGRAVWAARGRAAWSDLAARLVAAAMAPTLVLALAAAALAGPGLAAGGLAAVLLAACVSAAATVGLARAVGDQAGLAGRRRALRRSLDGPGEPSGGRAVGRFACLELRDVGFAWPDAPAVIAGVSLVLRRGEVLALAGPSGSGKSTLARLMLGLLKPQTGSVRLNGAALDVYDPIALRRLMGAVLQDAPLGVMTLRGAVAGDLSPDDPAVTEAIDLAGLREPIAALPMGLQTLMMEGVFPRGLVGPVLIARALARRPQLLLIDETLADLAPEAATALVARLREAELTLVLCAHAPAILALADRVVALRPR